MSSTPARAIACLAIAWWMSACARPPVPTAVAARPGPTPPERLAVADRLVRSGCLDCLIEAYGDYQALRALPSTGLAPTLGAIRAAGLIAIRQRELGMVDEGYLQTAKRLAAGTPDLPAWVSGTLDVVEVLDVPLGGVNRPMTSDAALDRMRVWRANRDAYSKLLRDFSEVDELSAYAWLTLVCSSGENRDVPVAGIVAGAAPFRDAPLMAFKEASCRGVVPEKLTALAAAEPRFGETAYLLGLVEVGRRKLDDADTWFDRAYAWRPRWPALTQSMANVAMTAEEFARAERLYGETLSADPEAADALLGRVKALTYLGQAVEAIAAVDQLLGQRWHLGDARYWRALNESQLARTDEAWTDVELADKLLINADVPKLAGLIAYRRQQLDVSRAKFELSRERNRSDCEVAFYLGVVLGDQREWARAAGVLQDAAACLEAAEQDAIAAVAAIRASSAPAERQARQIARREKQIADGRRMMATSWFNTAVAYFSLSNKAAARQFAEKVADDGQFGDRAREILARLVKSP
jgi:tetratricopeptide (TPR) repeat protein